MTTFIVYHIETARIEATYQNKSVAKGQVTKLNRKGENYAWTTRDIYDDYVNIEVDTYNMLDPTRKPLKIRKADKGGCCDPATETYHSM